MTCQMLRRVHLRLLLSERRYPRAVASRLTNLFVRTLREDPSGADAASHKWLVRAGYVRRQAPGIFAWLPLGLRVRQRLESIVHDEMRTAGAQQVHFPALLPKEPYEVTGRWDDYGDGIFRLKDRKGAQYLLAPTHEEVFTLTVKDLYSSYRDLPLMIYQIQDKYRDEARPRGGLLRGREFSMKDAYSFDVDQEGLDRSYQSQRDAYERIFNRLGIKYVVVRADAGAMGGSRSEEFLHPTDVGEDTFVRSDGGYAANVEAFRVSAPAALQFDDVAEPTIVDSPETPTIATLVDLVNKNHPHGSRSWTASDTLKNVVLRIIHADGKSEIVVVGVPGDRDVDLKRAEVFFSPSVVEPASEDDFSNNKNLVKGYIGPWSETGQTLGDNSPSGIRYLVDPRVVEGSSWITGANVEGKHVMSLVCGRDFLADDVADVASINEGDEAPDGSGPVSLERGMEIGHVFQLGTKYAESLGLQVLDEEGRKVTVTMGSYGIGVTRLMAVLAEVNHDERGLKWPESVAPFDLHIVATGKDESVFSVAEDFVTAMESRGKDVLYDDRIRVSAGAKFADAELIGIPHIVIIGRGAKQGIGEYWNRLSGEKMEVSLKELSDLLISEKMGG